MATASATAGVDIVGNSFFSNSGGDIWSFGTGTAQSGDSATGRNGIDFIEVAIDATVDLSVVSFVEWEVLRFAGAGTGTVSSAQLVAGILGTTIEGNNGTTQNVIITTGLASYDLRTLTFTNWETSDTITLTGDSTNQTLRGSNFADTINGGDGADLLYGHDGNDSMNGGNGDDKMFAGSGSDTMSGGDGNDQYIIDDVGDIVIENAAEGTADLVSSLITYTLTDNVDNLRLRGTADIDGIGNGENNLINGNSGNNSLGGGAGNDVLIGGAGNDVLGGGADLDYLRGGAGADTFFFDVGDLGANGATTDRILDFSSSQGDKIDFSILGLTSFIGDTAFGGNAGEFRSFQLASGKYAVQIDFDGDGATDATLIVAALDGPLAVSDFILAS